MQGKFFGSPINKQKLFALQGIMDVDDFCLFIGLPDEI